MIGAWLNGLRKQRDDADYSEDKKINKNLAEKCIEKVKKVVNCLYLNIISETKKRNLPHQS